VQKPCSFTSSSEGVAKSGDAAQQPSSAPSTGAKRLPDLLLCSARAAPRGMPTSQRNAPFPSGNSEPEPSFRLSRRFPGRASGRCPDGERCPGPRPHRDAAATTSAREGASVPARLRAAFWTFRLWEENKSQDCIFAQIHPFSWSPSTEIKSSELRNPTRFHFSLMTQNDGCFLTQ